MINCKSNMLATKTIIQICADISDNRTLKHSKYLLVSNHQSLKPPVIVLKMNMYKNHSNIFMFIVSVIN